MPQRTHAQPASDLTRVAISFQSGGYSLVDRRALTLRSPAPDRSTPRRAPADRARPVVQAVMGIKARVKEAA
jgi:hypothetical protein